MLSQLTYKEYLKVTIPFMLSTATQPLLGAVNTAVMGHMSEAFYIAAVSLGVILFNNIYWLFGFLRVSTTSFSAQALGSESAKDKFLALARPLLIAIVISLIFLIIYPWIFKYYVLLMKPESQIVELMKNYCDIIIWGAPFVLINYVTLGWLMGQMIIRYTMFMQISMNVLNIILSIVFVFIMDIAIAGASMGTVTLASNAIILEIIFIVVYFIDGMANGVSVFSGKAKGYKDINLLNSVLKISLRCLAVFIIFISVIMYITKSYFINMMTDLAIVANYANDYSIYLILHPICACVGLLLYGMYTGIGNTASIRNMMFVAVIFFYICQKILMSYLGNDGIWLTYNLTYLLESIILILYLPSLKKYFN